MSFAATNHLQQQQQQQNIPAEKNCSLKSIDNLNSFLIIKAICFNNNSNNNNLEIKSLILLKLFERIAQNFSINFITNNQQQKLYRNQLRKQQIQLLSQSQRHNQQQYHYQHQHHLYHYHYYNHQHYNSSSCSFCSWSSTHSSSYIHHQKEEQKIEKEIQEEEDQKQHLQNKQNQSQNHSLLTNRSSNNSMLMIKSYDDTANNTQAVEEDEKDEKKKDEDDSSVPCQRRESFKENEEQLKNPGASNECTELIQKNSIQSPNQIENQDQTEIEKQTPTQIQDQKLDQDKSEDQDQNQELHQDQDQNQDQSQNLDQDQDQNQNQELNQNQNQDQVQDQGENQNSDQTQIEITNNLDKEKTERETSSSSSSSSGCSSQQNNTDILNTIYASQAFEEQPQKESSVQIIESQQESQDLQQLTQEETQELLNPLNDLNSTSLICSSLSSSGENSNNFTTVDGQKGKNNKNGSQATNSPKRKTSKGKLPKTSSFSKFANKNDEDSISKHSDTSGEYLVRGVSVQESTTSTTSSSNANEPKLKATTRLSERAKKKSWYNLIYPNYKSRAEDFKKLFKDVPNDERLIVDYSCALQRDILVQGRLYVSQNYVCFHANIFSWETYLTLKWKDVTSITKEKTALVIPNAISICTSKDKYFFATFAARDKAFLMLFRVWQNTLMNKQLQPQEIWQYVHNCYGEELGLTTDDEDYIDPTTVPPIETETELEFISAIDDPTFLTSTAQQQTVGLLQGITTTATLIGTTLTTNSPSPTGTTSTSGGDSNSSNSNLNPNNCTPSANIGGNQSISGNSSTSSGSGPRKSKSKSYFFTQKRSSSTTASASASGSDNKASGDNKISNSSNTSKMKANAKEITLISAKPEEASLAGNSNSSALNATNSINNESYTEKGSGPNATASGASVGVNVNTPTGSAANMPLTNSPSIIKESKSSSTATLHEAKRKASKHKNVENIPTDVSDSSDFESNSAPFVATTECSSPHEGRQLLHTILPINIDVLFNMLFSKSKFLVDFHATRNSTDLILGDWNDNNLGQKTRLVNVTVQVAASVGPKTSKVTEHQIMRDCSKPGELYSIDVNSTNAGIPYADSFSVLMHYCLVRTVDDHTMLSVHAQIKYKKSIWAVVKGFIEKNTWAGLEDFYTSLLHNLQNETCLLPAKSKGRRPRRGKHKISVVTLKKIDGSDDDTSAPANTTENATYTTSTASSLTSPSTTDTDSFHILSDSDVRPISISSHYHSNNHYNQNSNHFNHHHHHHHLHDNDPHHNHNHNHNHLHHNHHLPNNHQPFFHKEKTVRNYTKHIHIYYTYWLNFLDFFKNIRTSTQIRTPEDTPNSQHHHHHSHHHHLHHKQELAENSTSPKATSSYITSGLQHDVIRKEPNYRNLSIFIVVLLGFLLAFNVILLSKLWKLEERVDYDINLRARLPNLSNMKNLPNNNQEWVQILREQEILHEKELKKWHKVLQTAIELLKKTEKTLAELMFH